MPSCEASSTTTASEANVRANYWPPLSAFVTASMAWGRSDTVFTSQDDTQPRSWQTGDYETISKRNRVITRHRAHTETTARGGI